MCSDRLLNDRARKRRPRILNYHKKACHRRDAPSLWWEFIRMYDDHQYTEGFLQLLPFISRRFEFRNRGTGEETNWRTWRAGKLRTIPGEVIEDRDSLQNLRFNACHIEWEQASYFGMYRAPKSAHLVRHAPVVSSFKYFASLDENIRKESCLKSTAITRHGPFFLCLRNFTRIGKCLENAMLSFRMIVACLIKSCQEAWTCCQQSWNDKNVAFSEVEPKPRHDH